MVGPPMGDVVQFDLFVVRVPDPPWRDQREAMAFPFLSLQKRRTRPIEFSHGGAYIEVHAPAKFGLATVWDWDLLIYAASHLNAAIERGAQVSPRVQFVPYDCLRQLRRGTSGRHYHELAMAVRRLRATTIITNIRSDDGAGEERPFSWLEDYMIPKRYSPGAGITPAAPDGEPDPSRPWEIKLPEWLFRAIVRQRDLLAVHPAYFALTGGIERWLYRIARKAVPDHADPPAITFSLAKFHLLSGTTRPARQFAFDLRRIAEAQPLPEYRLRLERCGRQVLVTLYNEGARKRGAPAAAVGLS
jgi:plasmid replication initiation protein